MDRNFQINSLDGKNFKKYFSMPASELSSIGAYLFNADECPCYPCRVSLTDADIGESVLAISYEHHPALSPYHSVGPIFIRKDAQMYVPEKNEIPAMLRHRLLSVRGYNSNGLMIGADTNEGNDIETILVEQFHNASVEYIHIHNAAPGCFNCSVTRA